MTRASWQDLHAYTDEQTPLQVAVTNRTTFAFRAYASGATSIPTATATKVDLASETFDVNTVFDSTTNYRYQPTEAGYYQINGAVEIASLGVRKAVHAVIMKNGSVYSYGVHSINGTASTADVHATVSDVVFLDGIDDYVELGCEHDHGSNLNTVAGSDDTYLSGFRTG